MKDFTTFNEATGKPIAEGSMPNNLFKNYDQPGIVLQPGRMAATHYWDGSAAVEKVPLGVTVPDTATTGDTISITGLDNGAVVIIDGVEHATDGTMDITFDTPGEYMIEINEAAYLYESWKVNVSDPS